MGKNNRNHDERKTCSICFCKTGLQQAKVRHLPNGTIAEEECINNKIFKEVIVPVKKVAQLLGKKFDCLSLKNPPEDLFNSIIFSLKDFPIGKIEKPLQNAANISQEFFGKPIQSFLK
ncbi:MAG: hypothetical protein A2Y98_00390 [Candidatus Portnoybacteria bacterium RBG_19FT_COMBO_36_7]|uniref:Uncharacterized protein n=1 Tax=Candidatus Portnoybacteria bacterium RBG_19FT_COMBO_36_7 TaxID=1801992 RepID=A0A1G2F827_9BACT|nr:MAG: hypothetical protein A2Y98_00390 [Candidatus Portnoybacteria bacterium RBG_19FT_COMBO_36_7]